jgi:ornithine cyclodeaminase/alanine dehydrogenase-like protein (mu-crystallin family)
MDRLVRVFGREDVARSLDRELCIDAVAAAFARHHRGQDPSPVTSGVRAVDGGFHVKSALGGAERRYFAVKCNANFPLNPERRGLPTIQGGVMLFDGEDGRWLAVLDSAELTAHRTAAATAVAARFLARPASATLGLCGCGVQGRMQAWYLAAELPITRVLAWDLRRSAAQTCARELEARLGVDVDVVESVAAATLRSDVVVTSTPSREWILGRAHVKPGTFVAGVGADSETKQELEPELLAESTVVVDVLEQAAVMGDLHHTLAGGQMQLPDVHGELGAIVAGSLPGRQHEDEVIIFDSTGSAFQDVAVAVVVFERGVREGTGLEVRV